MANWAYIENGQVVEKYDILPDCWKNISNFYVLSSNIDYLATLNWVPVIHPEYTYDPTIQQLSNVRYTVENMIVTEEWDVIDIPKSPEPTLFDIEVMLINETKNRLDLFAQTRGYDNILSACSYATDTDLKFQTEGQYCIQMRSQTWTTLNKIISDIKSDIRSMPLVFSSIENELPLLTWPE